MTTKPVGAEAMDSAEALPVAPGDPGQNAIKFTVHGFNYNVQNQPYAEVWALCDLKAESFRDFRL